MENASWPTVPWDNITKTSTEAEDLENNYIAHTRNLVLKVIHIVLGTLGVIDNLFVIVVFVLFIKITEKVFNARLHFKC